MDKGLPGITAKRRSGPCPRLDQWAAGQRGRGQKEPDQAPKNVVWWQDVGAACQDADGDSRALSSKRQHPFYKRNS
uniref:HDC08277 n=1 Tax=Drosophila melanogaster TaxID=7227 RepID=Q6ILV5_DROME|nr:TPA_inf: HDC08277 [Drosophila melanogaster]